MFAIVQGSARRVRLNVTNSLGYFLIKFTNQYNQDKVLAVFQNIGSVSKPIILITDSGGYGTPNPLDGEVNLNIVGNWEAKIYSQSSSTNLNIELTNNLLSTTTVFVQGNESCVVAPRNTPVIKTCQDVKDCLGISASGDETKYLNEQGDWVTISSTSSAFKETIEGDGIEANDSRVIVHGKNNEAPCGSIYVYDTTYDVWQPIDWNQGVVANDANTITVNLANYLTGNTNGTIYKITIPA
jgi:hypothetical protein